jgi:carotenoid 1,2-hydratase
MKTFPDFDRQVAPGGYAWWYLDAFDAVGGQGLAIIAFVGSVFSPYYAWARRKGHAEPENHCAINVGLYTRDAHHWAMTERGRGAMTRSHDCFQVGSSVMRWDNDRLIVEIDERAAPLPRRLKGRIILHPQGTPRREFALEQGGVHHWRPIFPRADVEVEFDRPNWRWCGVGYFDSNNGDEPLEHAFSRWQWTRTHLPGSGTLISYCANPRHHDPTSLMLHLDGDQLTVQDQGPGHFATLRRSFWGMDRALPAAVGVQASVRRTLEDGPFYARSMIAARHQNAPVLSMHESLDLDRFASPWVQCLLPFRMPRALGQAR